MAAPGRAEPLPALRWLRRWGLPPRPPPMASPPLSRSVPPFPAPRPCAGRRGGSRGRATAAPAGSGQTGTLGDRPQAPTHGDPLGAVSPPRPWHGRPPLRQPGRSLLPQGPQNPPVRPSVQHRPPARCPARLVYRLIQIINAN